MRRWKNFKGLHGTRVVEGAALPSSLPPGTYAFVTSTHSGACDGAGEGALAIVDTSNGATITTIPVGDRPDAVVVSPDGLRAYVANFYDGSVSVIDSVLEAVVDTITLPVSEDYAFAADLALSPDARRLYVTDSAADTLDVIDTAYDVVIATIPVGRGPEAVVASADKVYVANRDDGTLSVIDAASFQVTTTVEVGAEPTDLALIDATGSLYVASVRGGEVTVLDTATDSVRATAPVSRAYWLATSPDQTRVYVGHDHQVSVLDSASAQVLASVGLDSHGGEPHVAVGPDGRIYAGYSRSHDATVDVFDAATLARLDSRPFTGIVTSLTVRTVGARA